MNAFHQKLHRLGGKSVVFWLWVAVIAAAMYGYFFERDFIHAQTTRAMDLPASWRYAIFLAVGCVRGFTLVPVTYVILLGLVFLPAWPAYILTMLGVMVSSATIYYFADYLGLAHFFEKNHAAEVQKLRSMLQRHELPIVAGWSFFPFAPTDVICYVCGSLEIGIRKFLLGILIGEGIAVAIYIFLGKELLLSIVRAIPGF